MNINQLTFRDIEYLITVAELLHFGESAKKLHVSQPTLSEQIKKCEGLFGKSIFERGSKYVKLTPEGEVLIPELKRIWLEASKLTNIIDVSTDPLSGEFKLGIIATLAPYLTPYILLELKKQYPKLSLFLFEGLTDHLLSLLQDGKLDAVIASKTFSLDSYLVYDLFFEPFFYGTTHKLDSHVLTLGDVKKDQLLLLEEGNCLTDETLELCFRSKPKNNIKTQATSLETLRQMVALGLGDSFFPLLSVKSNNISKKLIQYYPFKDHKLGRSIIFVTRNSYPNKDNIRLFVQLIKKEIQHAIH